MDDYFCCFLGGKGPGTFYERLRADEDNPERLVDYTSDSFSDNPSYIPPTTPNSTPNVVTLLKHFLCLRKEKKKKTYAISNYFLFRIQTFFWTFTSFGNLKLFILLKKYFPQQNDVRTPKQ